MRNKILLWKIYLLGTYLNGSFTLSGIFWKLKRQNVRCVAGEIETNYTSVV